MSVDVSESGKQVGWRSQCMDVNWNHIYGWELGKEYKIKDDCKWKK